ncbi:DUF7285 family protein [Halorussus halophilus]|uniref:DUF7285 family protein n=1 Tax=Halorussus halophilus TaxID=2650975 RepID=UPI001301873B|nr:hypothetical protein [Halorussus halophilus]
MSRWSAESERRPGGSDESGQVEPLAALVAVFAVGVALSAYAGVLSDALPTPERNVAEPTAHRALAEVRVGAVVSPERLQAGILAAPEGYDCNLTLTAAGSTWHAGPPVPERKFETDTATRTASVRVAPGHVRPGTLRVVVWS